MDERTRVMWDKRPIFDTCTGRTDIVWMHDGRFIGQATVHIVCPVHGQDQERVEIVDGEMHVVETHHRRDEQQITHRVIFGAN